MTIQIGTFAFSVDDYPTSVQMGGTSLVAVEKYPGGHKLVQQFGNFQDTITLKGTFMYNGATTKMNAVNRLWYSMQPQLLTLPGFSPRYVLITSFKPTYYNDYQIDYELTLEPLDSDNVDAVLYSPPQPTTPTTTTTTTTTSSSNTTTTPTSATPRRYYIVKAGDTLWGIANKYYGDGSQYTKIVTANNIKNPSLITVGEKIIIP